MKAKLSRVGVAFAALAAGCVGLITTSGAGTALAAPGTLTPGAGNQGTPFTIGGLGNCTSDENGGYDIGTFIVGSTVATTDLRFLQSSGAQPKLGATPTYFVSSLYDTGVPAQKVKAVPPDGDPLGGASGISSLSLSGLVGNAGLVNGKYKIGVACYATGTAAIDGANYWEAPITISSVTAAGFSWQSGWAPDAPTVTAYTDNHDGTASIAFTPAATGSAATSSQ